MNNFLVGGVEHLIYDLISCLDKDKFAVSIITVFGSGPLEACFQKLNIPIYFAAGKLPFYAKRWSYKVLWLAIFPVVLVRLVLWLWCFHPAAVVTSLYQADILGMLASWLAGIPQRVLIHHDTYPVGRSKAWLKRKIGVGLATRIVAVSQTVKDFIVNYFDVAANRIDIIYNGIATEQFTPSHKFPDPSHLVLGMIGRLEPIKGPLIFAQALQILQTKFGLTPQSCLGGEGSLRPELMNYTAKAQLHNLTLDGEIKDVPTWLKKIDILINPSLSEGFSLVVLEGLAANKLVVVSDLSATRELVTDGVNGCLFPVGDATALANILQHLLTDPTSFSQLKQRLQEWRQQHLSQYDINYVTQRYEQLFLR